MRIPVVQGVIDRRILVNYRVDPRAMADVLPAPFRPLLVDGHAIGGICLIRLKGLRPKRLPLPWGLASENAAHRVAVEWDEDGATRQGVYIPRRDTDSRLNVLLGGRVFPGVHHHARFDVIEEDGRYSVAMSSHDGEASVTVAGRATDQWPAASVFQTLDAASNFFRAGSVGYSDNGQPNRYDGLELRCDDWNVRPLAVESVRSSFFEDESRFPRGSVEFDSALLMENVAHEWHGQPDLNVSLCASGDTPSPRSVGSAVA